ncbi:4-oxalocrotonate tautomerase [Rhizobiales bacterium RZME27]|uniref:4-oxalocrotonate tautomerase n=1 Tax=Endobacterium cereale TaxID=2663029 RepID=A0A6A8A6G7_9HYPH|nr:tautomerase family protein [Endobacterium cereale]MEB2846798.1 tautomerase family protein [Endobacterium cereale]MQY45427.1 4-oxalocrotonate tautomerase [Endobacterium cereale]
MPHVVVKMYAGKTEEQKQALALEIQKALMTAIGSTEKSISVAIEDVDPSDWVEKVYQPDIAGKPDLIYKKPGYDPLA